MPVALLSLSGRRPSGPGVLHRRVLPSAPLPTGLLSASAEAASSACTVLLRTHSLAAETFAARVRSRGAHARCRFIAQRLRYGHMLRQSRLLLCDLTARTIQLGLSLLGIKTVERM